MRFVLHALVLSAMVSSISFAGDGHLQAGGFLQILLRELCSDNKQSDSDSNESQKGKQLLNAARDGDCDTMRALLGDDDSTNLPLENALIKTIKHNKYEAFSLLLEHNVPVNGKVSGYRPLTHAADRGDTKLLIRLLGAGAYLYAIDKDGDTALHLACLKGHYDAAIELKRRGSSLVARNLKNRTPLHYAAISGNEILLQELLLDSEEWDTQDDDGATPFLWALNQQHEGAANLLFDKGARYNIADVKGNTPLHLAACFSEGLVQKLLQLQIIAIPNKRKKIPLHKAASHGNESIVRELLPISDINAQDGRGDSPLIRSLKKKRETCARILIAEGAQVTLANNNKETALHIAAFCNCPQVVTALLENKADPLAEDENGDLPINIARGNKKIQNELLDVDGDLLIHFSRRNEEIQNKLLKAMIQQKQEESMP